jgi:hypothetical protein
METNWLIRNSRDKTPKYGLLYGKYQRTNKFQPQRLYFHFPVILDRNTSAIAPPGSLSDLLMA